MQSLHVKGGTNFVEQEFYSKNQLYLAEFNFKLSKRPGNFLKEIFKSFSLLNFCNNIKVGDMRLLYTS